MLALVIALTPEAANPQAARLLVDELHRVFGAEIGGFNADARIGSPYVREWTELIGAQATVHMQLRIFLGAFLYATHRTTELRAYPIFLASIFFSVLSFWFREIGDGFAALSAGSHETGLSTASARTPGAMRS